MAFWKPGAPAPGWREDPSAPRSDGQGDAVDSANAKRRGTGIGAVSGVDREDGDAMATGAELYNPNEMLSLAAQRAKLPVYKYQEQILYLIKRYRVTVIVGSTGCGKTTQIPQYIDEAGWTSGGKTVACTQPRRVAATTVAARVAQEMHVALGQEVGYTIRFDDCSDAKRTRIKYMTDGILLRETMLDPLLNQYSVIMLDEAHERTVSTDILVGLLKKIMKKREDLKLVVSSATIDAEEFKDFFETNRSKDKSKDTVYIMSIEGRVHPVDHLYLQHPTDNYISSAIETVYDIHFREPDGDILLFLTGQQEIDTVVSDLRERIRSETRRPENSDSIFLLPLPMYAGLPADQQKRVFDPTPKHTRKVVVTTNIAETSITIDGIVYVVDTCFAKQHYYNPKSGLESLHVSPISQAAANQRAGRAGRVRPGKCFRLLTEDAFHRELEVKTVPEMKRVNLAQVVLQLKALGINDIMHFDFLSPPTPQVMMRALELLYALGALDEQANLTAKVGIPLAELPVEPMIGKALLSSLELGCSEEMLTIGAMLTVQTVFLVAKEYRGSVDAAKRKFSVQEGDHLTLFNVYNQFVGKKKNSNWCYNHCINYRTMLRAVEVRRQLKKYIVKFGSQKDVGNGSVVRSSKSAEVIRKCIVCGFFPNVAKLYYDGTYKTLRDGATVDMHPSSVLFKVMPEWVVFHEVVETEKSYMREVSSVDPMWLRESASHYYKFNDKTL